MKTWNYLLHPELVQSMPLAGDFLVNQLNERIAETFVDDFNSDPAISVVIRAYNEANRLESLFEDIHRQLFGNEVEVIVVDNESTDRTVDVASYYGAEVVKLEQSGFTYPKSLNKGVEAASHDTVMLTVGHAGLSNTYNLHAGARHFRESRVAGAFGPILPNTNASKTENVALAIGNLYLMRKPAHKITRAGMGVLGATNAVISKSAWEELGRFDERYAAGGEDTALAANMLVAGYEIFRDPAISVHHTHGLGPVDSLKQYLYWERTLRSPGELDKNELLARRPDLRNNLSA